MNGLAKVLEQQGTKLIDDFLRRELRVGDPRNPTEVVQALQRRYPAAAARIDQEGAGMPVRFEAVLALPEVVVPARATPGSREAQRVLDNLEKDLAALIDAPANREWKPELTGWRDTLMREYAEGMAAARFAQDPAQRERAFLALRKVGEYARLARLVGVMNLPMNCEYRRLASTLDDAATVIRILMGEALYDAGLADGGFIIQVPVTDLRVRRDALILAVRRLSGLAEEADGDWGDAVAAYRALLAALDAQSAPDLRVYLRDEFLLPIADGLVSAVARQDPQALRQVAATAPIEITRMRRLLLITNDLIATMPPPPNPIAAALSFFVQALQLFVDAFLDTRSGARLIDLAVPLPMAAQQTEEADGEGRQILRDVVSRRAEYAREVECYLACCGCGVKELRCQVKLDKVLYDVDRAIDLYAQGAGVRPDWGDEERRAGVYGVIAQNLAADRRCVAPGAVYPVLADLARAGIDLVTAVARLAAIGFDDRRQEAEAVARSLGAVMAAADACCVSRPLGESILRDLIRPAVDPALIATLTAAQQTQLTNLVSAARDIPPTVEDAILLAVNVAETAAGDSGVVAISTVDVIPVANDPAGLARQIRENLPGGPAILAPAEAVQAITTARAAILAALLVAEQQTAARVTAATGAATAAEVAARAAQIASDALDPALFVLERAALEAAAEAAIAAARAARAAAALEAPGGIAALDLWRSLDRLGGLLQTALPGVGTPERQQLLTSVFEEQLRTEQDWATLVASLAPRCLGPGRAELVAAGRELLYGNPNFRVRNPRPIVVAPPPPAERVATEHIAVELRRAREDFSNVVHLVASRRPPPSPPAGQPASLTEQELGDLWNLLALTHQALREPGEWNRWMRSIRDGQTLTEEIEVDVERDVTALGRPFTIIVSGDVRGWLESLVDRPRTLQEAVGAVAGRWPRDQFDELFRDIGRPTRPNVVRAKERLWRTCVQILESYGLPR